MGQIQASPGRPATLLPSRQVVNIMSTVNSSLASLARAAALCAALALGACNGNWSDAPAYVKIGGTVTGLVGTLDLSNSNAGDKLNVSADGAFAFPLQIANGATYAVTVSRQPAGQICAIQNGSGTATSNVTGIKVTCLSPQTLGGTISGLTGTLVLQDAGASAPFSAVAPTVTVAGAATTFVFPTALLPGAAYSVSVLSQPAGQTCAVANGSGTVASANISNVAITCAAFARRALPAIYTTDKAINYGPSRAGGPPAGELPTVAQITEDLTLMQSAGFRVLRMFGADPVSDRVLSVAAASFPLLKFQLGIYLQNLAPGATACVDQLNSDQIGTGVALANQYTANVVSVSVGNETSFAGQLPVGCLAKYVSYVRDHVPQPVTADDDWSFYAGQAGNGEKPDLVLPLLDFASIHTYPFSGYSAWNWQQTAVAAGPLRAAAMMNASLARAQATYASAANYQYANAAGTMVTTGASMPITIGETGWKSVQTRPAALIETYVADPVNAKWYYDLLTAWVNAGTGPKSVFYFEAFDETWKGVNVAPFDDGWGLWDASRVARYGLCGTPAGSACNANVYQNAKYFPGAGGGGGGAFATITFDDAALTYTLTGFGGGEDSTVVVDPTNAANKVARVNRSATALVYAGTTVSTGANFSVGTIPFTASATSMTVRVWSPDAGIPVRLKVEDAADGTHSVETEATITTAGGWQTLTFNFANPVTGTTALNLAFTYNKVSIFFDFGVDGATAGAKTYYFDDLSFVGGGGGAALTFSSGFAVGNRTVEGGEFGGFSGSNQDGFNCTGGPAWCGSGGTFTDTVAAAASSFYYYYQTPTPATALYMGIFELAPGVVGGLSATADTAGIQVNAQTTIKFTLGENNEYFTSGTNNFAVDLALGKLYMAGGGACHLQLRTIVTPSAAANTVYTVPLNSFSVVQDCAVAGVTTASALVASPISQVSFQGVGGTNALTAGGRTSGANLTVPTGSPAVYPTTLALTGGITFQ